MCAVWKTWPADNCILESGYVVKDLQDRIEIASVAEVVEARRQNGKSGVRGDIGSVERNRGRELALTGYRRREF